MFAIRMLVSSVLTVFIGAQSMFIPNTYAANSGIIRSLNRKELSFSQKLNQAEANLNGLKDALIRQREELLDKGYINKTAVFSLLATAIGATASVSALSSAKEVAGVVGNIAITGSFGGPVSHGLIESIKSMSGLSTWSDTKDRALKMVEIINNSLVVGNLNPEQKAQLIDLRTKFQKHAQSGKLANVALSVIKFVELTNAVIAILGLALGIFGGPAGGGILLMAGGITIVVSIVTTVARIAVEAYLVNDQRQVLDDAIAQIDDQLQLVDILKNDSGFKLH